MALFLLPAERLQKHTRRFDLVIVGGGIYGAALLWEATLKGLSALLLEKGDFSGATSANSLKIIHGGLRYVQQLDVKRIRESAREQETLMRIAPHLVHPLPCLMLTEKNLKRSKRALALAFRIYQGLTAGGGRHLPPDKELPSGKIISLEECRRLVPDLCAATSATGGALWWDAQVYNSERLVLDFVLSAVKRGGCACNYMQAEQLHFVGKKVVGLRAKDHLSGRETEIEAGMVINSAGPWIEKVLGEGAEIEKVRWAKAVNLILPGIMALPAVGVNKPGGNQRLLFLVPWRGMTMAGTWYFPCRAREENHLTADELAVCRRDLASVLPAQFDARSISFSHLGLVPVEEPDSCELEPQPAHHYRLIDHAAQNGPANLITVLGVKYTTARDVAAKTIAMVLKKTGRRDNGISSEQIRLEGGQMDSFADFRERMLAQAPGHLPQKVVEHMLCQYGAACTEIFQEVARNVSLAEPVPGTEANIRAELEYAVAHEHVYSLADLILRRTGIGSAKKPEGSSLDYCAEFMAQKCGWSSRRQTEEIDSLMRFYQGRIPEPLPRAEQIQ